MSARLSCQVLGPGEERELIAFLERDPVANLRLIWAVRRWGLLNLGLSEQGTFLALREEGAIRGVLFRDNLGLWRLAAEEGGELLVRAALELWGLPAALAAPQDEAEKILGGFPELSGAVLRKEEEVSMILEPGDLKPREPERARLAEEGDLESLVELEKAFQREYLGSVSRDWEIRLRMLRLVEAGSVALALCEGRAAAKAEVEASTPRADELGGVYTVPGFRRRGLAAAACSLLCGRSLSRGKAVRLEAAVNNHAALSLYRSLGFRELRPHLFLIFKGSGLGS